MEVITSQEFDIILQLHHNGMARWGTSVSPQNRLTQLNEIKNNEAIKVSINKPI